MILNVNIINNLKIENLGDLKKLKVLEENGYKPNVTRIAKELGKDRRTIKKYIKGYEKQKIRKKKSQFDKYYKTIKRLLEDKYKIFEYKRILWQFLKDNHGLKGAENSFRHYINRIEEFRMYFEKGNKRKTSKATTIRYETEKGKQAQIDWKESIKIKLKTGENIKINIFTILLSYSRYRIYRLSINRSQDILINFLDNAFEVMGGVPKEIICDNMKSIMDESRTKKNKGKINNKFYQFSKDYGFEIKPCVAYRPKTKGKVEAQMKILEEIKAYSNELDYTELVNLIERINNRENSKYNYSYDMIPIMGLEKEKDFLSPIPQEKIRNLYQITQNRVKVNKSSLITYKGNQYSVPPKYINSTLTLQNYDNKIHLYYNMKLVVIHDLSSRKINYKEKHYIELSKLTFKYDEKDIEKQAKENLKIIGERYNDKNRT